MMVLVVDGMVVIVMVVVVVVLVLVSIPSYGSQGTSSYMYTGIRPI